MLFPSAADPRTPSRDASAARLLAFDTSGDRLRVALGDGGHAWLCDEEGGPRASARLLPAVRELLAQAGLALDRLDAIAFGAGPGAFTGLRTACAVAQGLALGLDKPLLALDSLALQAEAARAADPAVDQGETGWVAVDARMDEVYAAAYAWHVGRWQVRQPPTLWSPEALAARWAQALPAWVVGNASLAYADRLPLARGMRAVNAEAHAAGALLRLARQAWEAGAEVDAAQAQPLYVRDKVALTTAEREARAAAAAQADAR